MADESRRVTGLSPGKLRRLMSRLTERQGTAAGIPRAPRGGAMPLSFAQERFWFLDRLGAGGAAYHIPAAVRLRGPLDALALERTLNALVLRHEALRTAFGEEDGRPVQTVQEDVRLALPRVDLSALPEDLRAGELARITRDEASRPFDLTRAPLLRALLVRLGSGDHRLALAFHHIVTDGWSLGVLVREVAALYPGFAAGAPAVLPELPIQPADHAVWERERLRGEGLESELAFWRERLAGLPPLELPADRPRPATPSFRGALATLDLPAETARALEALAQRERATPFMALLALFETLLLRYTGQSDFGVGTPVANRTRSEVEGLLGLFVNTLVLRADLSGRPGFAELLRRAREVTLAAFAHAELPFEKLVQELRPEREPGRNPWFQVLFTLQNQPWPKLRMGELDLALSEVDTGTARADLTLIWREREGGLAGTLEYSTDLFERASAERLLGHLAELLRGALADPEREIRDLPLLTEAERRQILAEWRGSVTPYPRDATVHELFEEQAAAAGDRVAVEAGDARLTYAELESRANQLARHLCRLGVGPDSTVGLAVPRSPEMVVGLLGILKAGGAYLPLDPAWPRERLAALADEARPRVLVTLETLLDRLPGGVATVCLDRDGGARAAERPIAPDGGATAGNLVYVLYTSGSTGKPKGVAVPHRAVVRLVRGGGFARLDGGQVFLQLAPLAFDASTLEIWGALCNGGRLVLAPPEPPSLAELGGLLTRHGVTTLWLTAGLFHPMVDEGIDGLRGLSQLLAGGDVLSPLHVRRALAALPGCDLINGYGPTENTTFTCCHLLADAPADAPVPIGRPIGNTSVTLLDRELRPVPAGVPGELYAGGDGLARGYLGRPDLTAERFVPSPLAGGEDAPGARLYRTGDLARFRPDGTLDFLGRVDQQVKIRGFRIEPGEIEAALAAHPGVRDAAVLAVEDGGERRLVAWVAASGPPVPGSGELRAFLEERLPAYMVPGRFVLLDALPVNPNGKVDRRALRELAAMAAEPSAGRGEAPPGTATEEILAGILASLLRRERVGIHDDFFELGGHSLLAIRLAARVRELLGVEIGLRSIFETPTVAELALRIDESRRLGVPGAAPPIARRGEAADPPPLSFAQERLWFLDRLEPGSTAYNVPVPLDLSGPLAPAALAAALAEVERRHEALRTVFATAGDDEPVQIVRPARARPLPVVDLAALPEPARRPEAGRLSGEEARRPFDLARGPLLRAALLRLGAEEHRLLLTGHHAVVDGWSVEIVLRELAALLPAAATGAPSPLPEPPVQYADFAVWQRRWLLGGPLETLLAHWRGRLAGVPDVLSLPTDRPPPAVQSHRGAIAPLTIAEPLAAALGALSRQAGATLFMTLLAAFQTLLRRYTGEEDLLVGSPVAGRSRAEVQGVVGLFANTLALRGDLAGDPGFLALLGRTREAALDAYAHQDLPFERLVEEMAPGRDLSRNALVQVFFLLQNDPALPGELAPGLRLRLGEAGDGTAKFDLKLALAETAGELAGGFEYAADLFDAVTAERMAGHFRTLLEGIVAAPEVRLSELSLLTGDELRQLLAGEAEAPADAPRLVPERFAEQAARTPEAPAVVCQGQALTYRELDRRANRLALRLREAGVGPEVPVAIGLERSLDLVVALLAAWKAGGAYVPLDPELPAGRRRALLDDSGARVVVTREDFAGKGVQVLVPGPGESPEGPAPLAGPGNLAYVLYTSGSTGRPKGVMVEHRQLASYVSGVLARLELPAGAAYATVSTFAADLGNTVVFAALTTGGTLHVLSSGEASDASRMAEAMERHPADCLKIVPSHLAALLAAERPERVLPRKLLVFGGEPLSWELVDRVRELAPECRVLNHYGPTETTVGVLTHPAWREDGGRVGAGVPLGSPLPGVRAAGFDVRLQPVPPGLPGELLVGGPQVSRGYLGRPDLTAERFVPDPAGAPGERVYRTGDLVRLRPGGGFSFLGRIDQQVKIRGFRVEPGEVQAALLAHPAVREALVLGRTAPGGETRLVGYVVLRGEAPEGLDRELCAWLGARLPEAMVPSAFVVLEAFPLTPNGKVDRRALPEPAAGGAAEPAALRTPTEELLAGLFEEVLETGRVGAEDGFFERGGHSLLATRLLARVRQAFGVEVELRTLFEQPAVRALAARIDELRRAGGTPAGPPLVPRDRHGDLPLSFAQERLWFLEQLDPGSAVYNVPRVFRLEGELSAGAFAAALSEIARRHEAVRTTFARVDGAPVQQVAPAAPVALPLVDLSALPGPAREAEARHLAAGEAGQPFDLGRGPLLRAFLLRQASEDHVALVTMHHLASDGWSVGVLVRELTALYGAFAAGRPSPLPELPLQYADFALWQRERLEGETLAAELAWWKGRLEGAPEALEIPADHPRPAVRSLEGSDLPVALSPAASRALGGLVRRRGATLFMGLLAGFQALLGRYTGQEDLLVGTPVANRNRAEVEGLIGFFVNTLVLRADASGDPSFALFLDRVRAQALAAYDHQDLPFEKLVEELRPERSLSRPPLVQVTLALQNAPLTPPALPGLRLTPLPGRSRTAKLDLALVFEETEDGISGVAEYSTDLFEAATVARLAGHLDVLLAAAVAAPETRLSELPILAEAERRTILGEWSSAGWKLPAPALIHEVFAEQAARTPGKAAAVCQGTAVTYRELDERAGRLARRLAGFGKPGLVGLMAAPDLPLLTGMLGILKAGSGFVPLDPGLPAERLARMIADCGLAVLAADRRNLGRAEEIAAGARVVCLDDDLETLQPAAAGMGDGTAYVIFTSGSTGVPKGVPITHENLVPLLLWSREVFGFGEHTRVLQSLSYAFDFGVFEILTTLLFGGTLYLRGDAERSDVEGYLRELREHAADTLHTTPSFFRAVAAEAGPEGLPTVRVLHLGGEALTEALVAEAFRVTGPECRVFNGYGPTEAAVNCALYEVGRAADWRPRGLSSLPIGHPSAANRLYVLDRRLEPVPPGVPGELLVGGPALSRGYSGRPDLTAARFLPDPFGEPGGRLYRTGDLVRFHPDRAIEFLGRVDNQVKVRGYRIELEEIEAALAAHPEVSASAVVAARQDDGEARLLAYVAARRQPAPGAGELRSFLGRTLPAYMIPAAFTFLPELPLNVSGKVDRKALPAPDRTPEAAYTAPRNGVEEILAGLWSEVLRVDRVGIHDNFFDLGGHSLQGVRLLSRVRDLFGTTLEVRSLFEQPTVAGMAVAIGQELVALTDEESLAAVWAEVQEEGRKDA